MLCVGRVLSDKNCRGTQRGFPPCGRTYAEAEQRSQERHPLFAVWIPVLQHTLFHLHVGLSKTMSTNSSASEDSVWEGSSWTTTDCSNLKPSVMHQSLTQQYLKEVKILPITVILIFDLFWESKFICLFLVRSFMKIGILWQISRLLS